MFVFFLFSLQFPVYTSFSLAVFLYYDYSTFLLRKLLLSFDSFICIHLALSFAYFICIKIFQTILG